MLPSTETAYPDHITIAATNDAKTWEWITALAAAGYDYALSHTPSGWVIHVPDTLAESAWAEIRAYETDNRNWPPRPRSEPRQRQDGPISWSPFWVAGFLTTFYAWLGPYTDATPLLRAAALDAPAVHAGEWWRIVTALTLHADAGHLVANIVALILLGRAACRQLGSGLAWAIILGAAITANAMEAMLVDGIAVSVGASTAAFAALGLLAAHRGVELAFRWRFHPDAWQTMVLPLGAGIAMLALLGTGPRSDLAAHALGLLCGGVAGAARAMMYCVRRGTHSTPRLLPPWCQHTLELACLFMVLLAWRAAWRAVL